MEHAELEAWLREDSPARLEELWRRADTIRAEAVGEAVHLRGLIEISNHCLRSCAYCGIRKGQRIPRYRMSSQEVLTCVRRAVQLGYGTVVLQSGEDYGLEVELIEDLIVRIKGEAELAVTLSLGERYPHELQRWLAAGADRYLLRFETSDSELYRSIHPDLPGRVSDRIAMLGELRRMGFREVGSGVMIGIPGQSYASLARDIELFAELDLDMVGVGPYIPDPSTPLGRRDSPRKLTGADQVPNSVEMTYKVLALTRILCPDVNLPSTTALAALGHAVGRSLGLERGANVVMPNLTPPEYRDKYTIYPAKACLHETAEHGHEALVELILRLGRGVGVGPGGRIAKRSNVAVEVEE